MAVRIRNFMLRNSGVLQSINNYQVQVYQNGEAMNITKDDKLLLKIHQTEKEITFYRAKNEQPTLVDYTKGFRINCNENITSVTTEEIIELLKQTKILEE